MLVSVVSIFVQRVHFDSLGCIGEPTVIFGPNLQYYETYDEDSSCRRFGGTALLSKSR